MTLYRTTITFEVLSDEPIPDPSALGEIVREMHGGAYSGGFIDDTVEELDAAAMAAALVAQGSDPEFFALGEEFDRLLADDDPQEVWSDPPGHGDDWFVGRDPDGKAG